MYPIASGNQMMKFKAFIYQHTGIYLANKEENKYMHSDEFWDSLGKMLESPDFNMKEAHGILVGLWHLDHGFYRDYSYFKIKK